MGLVHAPYQRVLDAMVADGASVVLAGHTHGGQLALPVWGALVTNCDLDTRRAKGVSRWWPGAGRTGQGGGAAPSSQAPQDAAWLHVSAGLGTSPYAPVRFACRPGGDPAHPRRPRRLTHAASGSRVLGRWGSDRFRRAGAGRLSSGVAAPSGRRHSHGVWRSLVARVVRDDEAAGSNPVTPTRSDKGP